MAEVAFEGFNDGDLQAGQEWGLDGWSSQDNFSLMLTAFNTGVKASLTVEQCSILAASLIEHVKEVNDSKKDIT